MPTVDRRSSPDIIPLLFIGLFCYWTYLAFVTQPILVHDAKGYEDLGKIIAEGGWKAYLTSGPTREPIYPFLVSLAMRLSGGMDHHGVLIGTQVLFLLAAVLLLFLLLKRAGVSKWIAAIAVLYAGISPALVNSALSQYSEIVTYVFILGIILAGSAAWKALSKESANPVLYGMGLGGLFVGMTLVKGIYELIFPLFLAAFVVLIFQDRKRSKQVLIFMISAVAVHQACLLSYKALNLKYNGSFALTDRGAWALYGNTARRQEPLTVNRFFAGAAYNLFEEDACAVMFGRADCHFWDVATSDRIAEEKLYEAMRTVPQGKRDSYLLRASVEKVLGGPLQYAVLTSFDWVHMFFWETTRAGFVAYPDWMDKLFDNPPFQKGLRFLVGVLSAFAVFFAAVRAFSRKYLQQPEVVLAVYLVILHVSFYSLFATVARFALPIAPLFIFIIAAAAQAQFRK